MTIRAASTSTLSTTSRNHDGQSESRLEQNFDTHCQHYIHWRNARLGTDLDGDQFVDDPATPPALSEGSADGGRVHETKAEQSNFLEGIGLTKGETVCRRWHFRVLANLLRYINTDNMSFSIRYARNAHTTDDW